MTIDIKPSPVGNDPFSIRVITLEEHFTTPEYLAATAQFIPAVGSSTTLDDQLLDLDDGRIAAMDEGGVDIQVLSLAAAALDKLAPAEATALVRQANDAAFGATQRHPQRLRMFATLALKEPEAAAAELERGVTELGCLGGFLNGTQGGSFLDDLRYTPIFEMAERLDVPLYLHPTPPPEEISATYFSGLPERSAYFLSTAAWGWHAELGMHCLRLILNGVFDRHPSLKIIIGHMGEDLPFSLVRAQDGLPISVTGLKRTVMDYFLDHFYVTTSGYFTAPPFACALDVVGIDRLLYSVDYPYRSNVAGAALLENIDLAPEDLRKVAAGNAARILKLTI